MINNNNNNEEKQYLICFRRYRSVFSMDLEISKEVRCALNMHDAIQKLKDEYNSIYDIIAISELDESVNFWEDIEL